MSVTSDFIDLSDHDNFVEAVPYEGFAKAAPRRPGPLESPSPMAAVASGR